MQILVVPDSYLSSELLLGCYVLGKDKLTWDHKEQTLIWGNELYPIRFVQKRRQDERESLLFSANVGPLISSGLTKR